jgi:hypothetical protein
MKHIEDAMKRMVRAALETKKMQEHYLSVGLDDSALFEIYGLILDAIYDLLGEHTDAFEEAVTSIVMSAPLLSEERRVKMLMAEWKRNNMPPLPSPTFVPKREMNELYQKNGGYMTPEGDWE